MKIKENKTHKTVSSLNYNYIFNKQTGFFARWGKTKEDDPNYSPFGPEILDIEVSEICNMGCTFCYKSNVAQGNNMSLDTFASIFSKMPKTLTQIAFGIGDIDGNPDLWKILKYTRDHKVIPNITINGTRMRDEYYTNLSQLCGAVAVSNYGKNICYGAVQKLNEYKLKKGSTLKQVNIHQLLSKETLNQCWDVIHDMESDDRLRDLNAVVFLLMKPKGNRNHFNMLKDSFEYKKLVSYALDHNLPIGFDSCSAPSFLRSVKDRSEYKQLEQNAEPCESTLFSLYVDVNGIAWPCSFSEGEPGIEGIDILNINNFMEEVWEAGPMVEFREKLFKSEKDFGCRQCPLFDLEIR